MDIPKLDFVSRRTRFLGRNVMHRPSEVFLLDQVLGYNKFDKIVEFGTHVGGLTMLFCLHAIKYKGKVISFDIKSEPRDIMYTTTKPVLPLIFYRMDVFSDEAKEIVTDFVKEGRVLLYCDGGIKKDEFNIYVPYLKPDDMVIIHDVPREVKYVDINGTIEKYNVIEFNQEYIKTFKLRQRYFIIGEQDG